MAPDARLRFEIDRARGEAKLWLAPGEPRSHAALRAELEAQGVRFGISFAGIPDPTEAVAGAIVAHATEPSPGTDGHLELAFAEHLLPGRPRRDGSIDFHDRSYLHPVTRGAPLARYVRPTRGEPGHRLDGTEVAASAGKETLPTLGPGVDFAPDGTITAARDGVVVYAAGKVLDVTDLIEHKGDVDFVHGDLDARGTLIVAGDVRPDFSARATGDIVIRGHVDGGSVAAAVNVTVLGSVSGDAEGGGASAGGNLTCHHAISAELSAGDTIELQDSAYRCSLVAKRVICERGHGRIVGGETHANTIRAKVIGSSAAVPTLLVVGELEEERRDLLDARLARDEAQRSARKRGQERPRAGKAGRRSALLERTVVSARLAYRRRAREILRGVEIVVLERAHAGTVLRVGNHTLRLERDRTAFRAVYDLHNDRIEMKELVP